jgi:hypothetical protein
MLSKPASNDYFSRTGTFPVLLESVETYTEEDMNNKGAKKPTLTFVFNLGDLDNKGQDVFFRQGFVPIPLDDDGMPKMSGEKSRYYTIVSAAYGERFDPEDEKNQVELGFEEEYDSPEGIMNMPSYKDYQKGDERLKLRFLKVNGQDIIGKELVIELGYAEIPKTKEKSNKVSVIGATPVVKTPVRRSAGRSTPVGAPA